MSTINKYEKGLIFENTIKEELLNNFSDIYIKILNNVVIYDLTNNRITEIDLLLLTTSGIYVIESKNWDGIIYGNPFERIWKQFFNKKVKSKNYYNPIIQNNEHINFLIKYLGIEKNKFKSYIVFPNKTNIKYLKAASINNPYIKVLKIENLISEIIKDLKNDEILLSHEEIDKIYIKLKDFDVNQVISEIKNSNN